MENYIDKIAIVVGSSSGIGASISEELAKRGCIVVGLARRMDKLQELSTKIEKIQKVSKGTFHPIQCDILDEEQIQKTMTHIRRYYGIPSIVVNSAGVVVRMRLSVFDGELFDKIINTNARGPLFLTKIAVQLMSDNFINGHIININSAAGYFKCQPEFRIIYGASKLLARIFSQGIRELIAQNHWNIKITDISPGYVQTEMVSLYEKEWSTFLAPDDIAKACVTVLDTSPNVLIPELIIMPLNCYRGVGNDDKENGITHK